MTLFQPASKPLAEYHEWDPRYPEVVRAVRRHMGRPPLAQVLEHVGSTAVPGCGGKGVIDLIVHYPDGVLDETKAWLLGLGLSRQGPEFSRVWRESRPMYLGWYDHLGCPFLIYVHVLHSDSDELRRFLEFRDLLTARPDLVAEYCALKRRIISESVTDTDEYAVHKRPFMRQALGAGHALRD